jgi:uncharacterized glyoxalase superfamily protein PhnB
VSESRADIQPELWVSDGPAAVAGARFWVSTASEDLHRFSPNAIGGATGRVLLVVDDPDSHGWRLGRFRDPFGHEWEVGRPLGTWPPEEIASVG